MDKAKRKRLALIHVLSDMSRDRATTARVYDYAPRYNAAAVDNAIAASNRAGRHIGKAEATAIHRLLKGRH